MFCRERYIFADYISKDNKKAALKLIKELYKSFNIFCLHPEIGFERKDFTKLNKVIFTLVAKVIYSLVTSYDLGNMYSKTILHCPSG